jgi:hypothetical protein
MSALPPSDSPPLSPDISSAPAAVYRDIGHYRQLHYYDEQQYWKQVMCRPSSCELCNKVVGRWFQVEYGDDTQDVMARYCSQECCSRDWSERVQHCFNNRAPCVCLVIAPAFSITLSHISDCESDAGYPSTPGDCEPGRAEDDPDWEEDADEHGSWWWNTKTGATTRKRPQKHLSVAKPLAPPPASPSGSKQASKRKR